MNVVFFLVVNSNKTTRTCKSQPDLKYNEISIKCNLELPDEIFKKPVLTASIVVPDKAINRKPIDAELTNNIEQVLQQNLGMEIKLTVGQE